MAKRSKDSEKDWEAELEKCAKDEELGSTITLYHVALFGKLETVKLLVERKPETDANETAGFTALMQAARNGDFTTMQTLISAGAKLNLRSAHVSLTSVAHTGRRHWRSP
eukprot:CAMPEP_0181335344 /NCGR_PEP_ID=MMETSP1101-20121128/26778_1 /TAXON_ID=46948 /ORGANISM="Rhodomonas abbreviata, Strain Caron Lab Isolate" /LENGTH=109 /DNA_ID=CAMNT_0023445451 /DNA_START=257 /DNA_END=586 /DNA_ORIENTATION=-